MVQKFSRYFSKQYYMWACVCICIISLYKNLCKNTPRSTTHIKPNIGKIQSF